MPGPLLELTRLGKIIDIGLHLSNVFIKIEIYIQFTKPQFTK